MPRPNDREIEESYDRLGFTFDEEDEALLRHVLGDDEPRQGLHRHGDDKAYCQRHGAYYSGEPRCPACAVQEEDEAVDDYLYPGWGDE